MKKYAVCTGYSGLIYRLCLMNGIDCRIIDGAGHSRNIVAIDGRYYVCDATWDAGKSFDQYIYFLAPKSKATDMFSTGDDSTKGIFESYEIADSAFVYSDKPGEGEDKPGEGVDKPGEGEDKPGEEVDKPGEGEDKPGDVEDKPGDVQDKPDDGDYDFSEMSVAIAKLKNTKKGIKILFQVQNLDTNKNVKYVVYRKTKKGWTKVCETRKSYVYDKKVKNGNLYTYSISILKDGVESKKCTSKKIYRLTPVKKIKVKKMKTGYIISFKKNQKAKRYRMTYSFDKDFRRNTRKYIKTNKAIVKVKVPKKYKSSKLYVKVTPLI